MFYVTILLFCNVLHFSYKMKIIPVRFNVFYSIVTKQVLRLLISIRFISHELTIFFYFSRMAGTVLTS